MFGLPLLFLTSLLLLKRTQILNFLLSLSTMSSSSPSHIGVASGSGGGGRRRSRRRRRGPPPPPPPPHDQQNAFEVWPEPFVEALALQVAMDASSSVGRLASGPAIAPLFQVCTTWRAVSRSEYLWQNLTCRIWNQTTLQHDTWRDEFIYRHVTARNFRVRRYAHTTLHFDDGDDAAAAVVDEAGGPVNHLCLRLTLSDHYLAAGFSDGAVRLFHLNTFVHLHTFRPLLRDRLGIFSRAVTGIFLSAAAPRVVFSSLDGDIHISDINGGLQPTRRAQLGDVVNDGTLVDFTGCNRFWVGLYAGVPGRAIHIWDGEAEQLLFVGGTLTDPESLRGWRLLTELNTDFVGRVRVASHELAVACTGDRSLVFDLRHPGVIVGEDEPRRGIVVGSLDADAGAANGEGAYVTVNTRGIASVRNSRTMEEVRRFPLRGGAHIRGLLGAMNLGYVLMCAGGVIRVWDSELGEYLYGIRERVGDSTYLTASDRHVAASESDTTIHLWDFGA